MKAETRCIFISKIYKLSIYILKWQVIHTQNLFSAFNPSKVRTHTAVNTHTHREHTPGSWEAVGGPVPCSRALQSCYWGLKRALEIHTPHRQSLPDPRLELTTFGLRVQLSNIRPRLPLHILMHILYGHGGNIFILITAHCCHRPFPSCISPSYEQWQQNPVYP